MFDVNHIIQSGGLLLIAAIIFAESGMFVGFFFPGDTLLLTAGVFAAQGKLSLALTIVVVAFAAIAGDNTGYHLGRRFGPRIFKNEDGLFFRREYVDRAQKFYQRFGNRTMLIAHFFPIIRTFVPPVAGVAKMDYPKYFIFDAIGDTAWAAIVTLVGYWFGTKIPNLDHYIVGAVIAVVLLTLGPTLYHVAKALLEKKKTKSLGQQK